MVIDIPAGDGKIINLFLQCKMNLESKEDVLLPLSMMARATSIMLERRRPVSWPEEGGRASGVVSPSLTSGSASWLSFIRPRLLQRVPPKNSAKIAKINHVFCIF